MEKTLKVSLWLVLFALASLSPWNFIPAQDKTELPSQKTRDAIKNLSQTPGVVGKGLEALKETTINKLQQIFGEKPVGKPRKGDLDSGELPKLPERPADGRLLPGNNRDPFRPLTLDTKKNPVPRDNLSPLERFELGQLRVVGIVWDVEKSRAMIEDSGGLGYIVRVGTPIGSNEGKVKAIHHTEIIVQEFYTDFYGNKKPRDVSMKLPAE